ncbi:condensation domain-containing protein, partial [Streptomyces erythrochromogenes]|uniref:condensation domain-containing protein n=1 Tax=Streptomyces erythrochromogenes TaxID=285574 RepID=UPI00369B1091
MTTWFDRFAAGSDARLVNMYGITETTVHVTHQEITAEHLAAGGRLPAGRPLPSYQVFLLDVLGNPVPVGVAGEIHVAGAGLARGYLHRPELTEERFPVNPFGEPGERMYRSGDVARWRADGTLEYLGRADDQVKIRGFRIELGEIETVLVGHPGVREAVVVAHQGADGHRRLVAYAVTADGVATADLRTHLAAVLPDYMVPAVFVPLDDLPLTPSGKVDRRSLPAPEFRPDVSATDYEAPRNATEQLLAEVWSEVLGVEKVGIHDNFFDLGGDSILSIQVVSRARQALGIRLSPRLLFEAPTVAELADRAGPDGGVGDAAPEEALPALPRDGLLPMSFGQQRLWFLEDFNEGSTEYHSAAGLRLTGPLDPAALRAAVHDLVARHESLRTTFDVVGGTGVQVVHAVLEPQWREEEAADETRLREMAQQELDRPYDLRSGPLVRVLLVRLAAEEHVCVLGMHHIVTDGWSMGVAARELGELYAARIEGRPAALPAVAVQYADFAGWQRGRLEDGGLLEEQLGWWRERLAGIAPLELPTDRPRPALRTSAGAVHAFQVPKATLDGVKSLAHARGATLFMALTAAVQSVFARYTGQTDIAVGTASAGRERADLEQMIGFLVNTVVLRSHIEPQMPFTDLLDQVKETVLDAFAHQDVPFERLVEAVGAARDAARTPLVQAMVVLQNAPGMHPDLGPVRVGSYPMERNTALTDLTVEFEEYEGGLRALVEYSTELFDAATIARFGEHVTVLLRSAVADPSSAVAALPLLTAGELETLAGEWAGSAGVPAPAGTVHEWVSHRAAVSPDAVAVSCGTESLTYGELEVRANRLARFLAASGAGVGDLVALSVERSAQMVVGLLAILKSGAGYVPLDPAYPADRLAYMLEDSGARVLLTHRGLNTGLPVDGVTVIDLDDAEAAALQALPETAPETPATGDDLAYVIYTSGSTGRPKGVAVEHRTVLNLLANSEGLFGFGPDDVWSVFHSYAFDFSVWELWGALITGGRAVVVPFETSRSADAMWELLAAERVSVLSQTPSMFRELVESASAAGAAGLPDLRWVVFGGEALEPKHVTTWFDRFAAGSDARLVNMYGITETTVHVTHQEITAEHLA